MADVVISDGEKLSVKVFKEDNCLSLFKKTVNDIVQIRELDPKVYE